MPVSITSEVLDGELTIGLAVNTGLPLNDTTEIQCRVRVEEPRSLNVNGVVRAVADGIATPQFDVRISGGSTVSVSGAAERQNVFVSGTCRYQAGDLVSRDAVVNVSGTAFARLSLSEALTGPVRSPALA